MNIYKEIMQNLVGGTFSEDAFLTFRHYRFQDPRYDRSVEWSPTGGATVAIIADPNTNILVFTIARCSTNDLFNRKIGRQVSVGRMFTGVFSTCEWNRELPIAENIEAAWYKAGLQALDQYLLLSTKAHRYE